MTNVHGGTQHFIQNLDTKTGYVTETKDVPLICPAWVATATDCMSVVHSVSSYWPMCTHAVSPVMSKIT